VRLSSAARRRSQGASELARAAAPGPGRLPLDGIRVVKFTHMVMGPACGMILADLGAEVIKVEPPGGDNTRRDAAPRCAASITKATRSRAGWQEAPQNYPRRQR
jgi:hypothetical protein